MTQKDVTSEPRKSISQKNFRLKQFKRSNRKSQPQYVNPIYFGFQQFQDKALGENFGPWVSTRSLFSSQRKRTLAQIAQEKQGKDKIFKGKNDPVSSVNKIQKGRILSKPSIFKIDLRENLSLKSTEQLRKKWGSMRSISPKKEINPESPRHNIISNTKIKTYVYNHCNEQNLSQCILNYLSRVNINSKQIKGGQNSEKIRKQFAKKDPIQLKLFKYQTNKMQAI